MSWFTSNPVEKSKAAAADLRTKIQAAQKLAPAPTALGRSRASGDDTGENAVPRGEGALSGPTPPDALKESSDASLAALSAALKARRRGAAGALGLKPLGKGPKPMSTPKSLLGY